MDGLSLLHEARAAGLVVTAEGETLRIVGPKRADSLARRLLAHKAELMHALTYPRTPSIRVEDLDAEWRVVWEERASIMEYNGGLPRERAEAEALAEIGRQMERAGVSLRRGP
jgi:hypothetical protein